MSLRLPRFAAALPAVLFVTVALAGCTPPNGPCDGSPCPRDARCVPDGGVPECVPLDGVGGGQSDGGTDGGTHPGSCSPACSGATPACDFDTGTCVVCTAAAGCDTAEKPTCDTSVEGGVCVGCLSDGDCLPGYECNVDQKTCVAAPDAGTDSDGGVNDCTASFECDPPCDIGDTCVAGVCKPHVSCSGECDRGFHCDNGQCVLNGGGGPIQVTLRWATTDADGNLSEDLDLHVLQPDGCEIFYGNRDCQVSGCSGSASDCNGSLDLDSNPGCSLDSVNIENVIYTAGSTPPTGTYIVRVDDYARCDGVTPPVGYEVIVRENGNEFGYCGAFTAAEGDNGYAGSGTTIASFHYP